MDFNSLLNGLLAEENNTSLKSARTPFNNLIIWAILLLIFLGCGCNGGYGGNQCCCREKCKHRKRCCCRQSCCSCGGFERGCGCGSGCGGGFLNNNCIFIIAIAILIFCSCRDEREDRGGCANSLVDLDADGLVTVDEE
ncbi:hypothetical protein [Clostridium lundense]|uniref:hypothetical protein n=1 Tax=Clostridium lundense TaxID=319475 RepID=UPI000687083F|nr:hypothetical protein [Clostridium lundense]